MEIVRTVGRGAHNNISINGPGVSDAHAEITFAPGYKMFVEGLDANKSIFVNNKRVSGKYELQPCDILCLGEYVFPFEEHYPEMLKYKKPDPSNEEESSNQDHLIIEDTEQEVLEGKTGLKLFLYSLQFPKDRQKMQRIWILSIGAVMLLSLVLPFISWSHPASASFIVNEKLSSLSAIQMFMDLTNAKVSGAPLLYVLLYGLTMFMILGVICLVIMFLLVGANIWKPKNLLAIRRVSQIMLLLYGLNFFFQFLRFVWFWLDGENALVQPNNFAGLLSESRVYVENLGIGYWLCGVGILLVLRSTRNGLWQPNFERKWASLSFSFWLPYVMMLVLVHQGLGVIQTSVDVDRYKKTFGGFSSGPFNISSGEAESRICQGAPTLASYSYVVLIADYKREEANGGDDVIFEESDKNKEERFYITGIWLTLHGLFIGLIVLMLRKSVRGKTQLILSGGMLLCSLLLSLFVYQLIHQGTGVIGDIIQVSVGFGALLAILAGMGLFGEQLNFWNNRIVRAKEPEPLDDLG